MKPDIALVAERLDVSVRTLSDGSSASDRPVERSSTDPDDQPGVISRFFSVLFGTGDGTFAANYSEAVRRGEKSGPMRHPYSGLERRTNAGTPYSGTERRGSL